MDWINKTLKKMQESYAGQMKLLERLKTVENILSQHLDWPWPHPPHPSITQHAPFCVQTNHVYNLVFLSHALNWSYSSLNRETWQSYTMPV